MTVFRVVPNESRVETIEPNEVISVVPMDSDLSILRKKKGKGGGRQFSDAARASSLAARRKGSAPAGGGSGGGGKEGGSGGAGGGGDAEGAGPRSVRESEVNRAIARANSGGGDPTPTAKEARGVSHTDAQNAANSRVASRARSGRTAEDSEGNAIRVGMRVRVEGGDASSRGTVVRVRGKRDMDVQFDGSRGGRITGNSRPTSVKSREFAEIGGPNRFGGGAKGRAEDRGGRGLATPSRRAPAAERGGSSRTTERAPGRISREPSMVRGSRPGEGFSGRRTESSARVPTPRVLPPARRGSSARENFGVGPEKGGRASRRAARRGPGGAPVEP